MKAEENRSELMKQIAAYLNFDGNCREAMTFYKKCLDADLQMTPFSEVPGDIPKEAKNRIMHARLAKGSAVLMASDTLPGMPFQPGNNLWVTLDCESLPEIEKVFTALSEEATIRMPLQETFWAARYGMLTDRFGVNWMLNLGKPQGG
jgi:PhnB protein